jgi:uncharacterized membrane protein
METIQKPATSQEDGQNEEASHLKEQSERRGEPNGFETSNERTRYYWDHLKQRTLKNGNEERLARGLAWFSIALGVTEVAAARAVAKFLGMREHTFLLRLMGLREIASGFGILSQRRPAGWMWARAGGDVIDLALLGAAAKSETPKLGNIAMATAAVAGVTALDICCAQELSRSESATSDRGIRLTKTIMINRPPEELYRFWRDFQNLPRFMKNLESVQVTGDKRSHWVAKGPAGKRIEWDADMTEDRPNQLIAWRSLGDSDVHHSGSVEFRSASGRRGTIVKVQMQYDPPGGVIAATMAKLFGQAPEQQVQEDLRRFKQIMETGEIVTTEGQPAGRARSTSWKYDQQIRRDPASTSA